MRVSNERTRQGLGDRITRATNLLARARGLLGKRRLEPGHGLWIEPCSSIHMFFMRFAIDVVFLDRDHRVVRVCENVRPWRVAFGGRGSRVALELPVGVVRESGTRPGDVLDLT